jgi:hypothetical protein
MVLKYLSLSVLNAIYKARILFFKILNKLKVFDHGDRPFVWCYQWGWE